MIAHVGATRQAACPNAIECERHSPKDASDVACVAAEKTREDGPRSPPSLLRSRTCRFDSSAVMRAAFTTSARRTAVCETASFPLRRGIDEDAHAWGDMTFTPFVDGAHALRPMGRNVTSERQLTSFANRAGLRARQRGDSDVEAKSFQLEPVGNGSTAESAPYRFVRETS